MLHEETGPKLRVVVIPDEFQVEDALWDEAVREPDAPGLDRLQPQRRILRWCGERGVPCLDLWPAFRAVPPLEDGDRHLYHDRDSHLNARGHEIVARELVDFVRGSVERHDVTAWE